MAAEAAARRRAPRHRPLPGLQRAAHLAHGPDGERDLRPARPGLRGRRRADVLLRHPAPPARAGGLGRALRQPHGRAAAEAWRRARWSCGARRASSSTTRCSRPTCRSPSATPPSSSPTAWTAASSRSPSGSRPPSRCTITARPSPGSARGWPRAGCSRRSRRHGRGLRARRALGPHLHAGAAGAARARGLAADGARRHRPRARPPGPPTWPASTTAATATSAGSRPSGRSCSSTT